MPRPKPSRKAFTEPAAAPKPEAAAMESLITPASGFGAMVGAQAAQAREREALWRSFQNGNPARYTQQIRATQSASSANQFWLLDSPELYDLMDEMMDKDRTIGATLNLIVSTIIGREQRFDVDDEEDAHAAEIAEACRLHLMGNDDDFGWESLRGSLALGMLAHGFSVNETIWQTRDGLYVPKMFMHRHPGQFAFSETGELFLWRDWVSGANTKPSEDQLALYRQKFILARAPALYGNPYGRSIIFPLRYLYFIKKDVLKYWVDWCDKFGTPLLIGTLRERLAGGGATQGTERETLLSELAAIFEELTRMSAVVIKPEQVIEKMDRSSGAGQTPQQALIQWLDGQMIKSLAGATLQIQEAEFGTRAQAEVHQDTGGIVIRPLAKILEAAINRGIVAPFVELNFGPDAPKPRYVIDMDEEIDVEQALEIIAAATENGVEFPLRQFRKWTGVEARVGNEPIIEPRQKAPAPQFDPLGDEAERLFSEAKKKRLSTRRASGASSRGASGSPPRSPLTFRKS